MPRVSVILPAFNAAKTIQQSIQSVLSQSFDDFELIVIDDGSSDSIDKIVPGFQDPRIVYVKNEKNLGLQKTLNIGLHKSVGEFVARIDADDIWIEKDKLSHQVAFLDKHPDVVLVGTGVVVSKNNQEILRFLNPSSDESIRHILLGKNCFVHSSVLYRRQSALSVGGYSEDLHILHVEDHDLWLKLGTKGKLSNLKEYDIQYTISHEQISHRHKQQQYLQEFFLIKKFSHAYSGRILAWIRCLARLCYYGYLKR